MIPEEEKRGWRDLLSTFPSEELFSLHDTVTNRQAVATSRQEAVRAILTYSQTSLELMRRQKMKKEYLFKYLHAHQVPCVPSAAKAKLVRHIFQFWDLESGNKEELNLMDAEEYIEEVPAKPDPVVQHNFIQIQITSQCPDGSQVQELSSKFADWFYNLLNSCHPLRSKSTSFPSVHFWDDVRFQMCIPQPPVREECWGAQAVSDRLLSLVRGEGLLFNPNTTEKGTRGIEDSHGMTMVMCCGMLHKDSQCIGVFEQSFLLIRDPLMENNWKIKLTKLRLQQGHPSSMPSIGTDTRRAIEGILR